MSLCVREGQPCFQCGARTCAARLCRTVDSRSAPESSHLLSCIELWLGIPVLVRRNFRLSISHADGTYTVVGVARVVRFGRAIPDFPSNSHNATVPREVQGKRFFRTGFSEIPRPHSFRTPRAAAARPSLAFQILHHAQPLGSRFAGWQSAPNCPSLSCRPLLPALRIDLVWSSPYTGTSVGDSLEAEWPASKYCAKSLASSCFAL